MRDQHKQECTRSLLHFSRSRTLIATISLSGTQRALYTEALTPSPTSSYNLQSFALTGNFFSDTYSMVPSYTTPLTPSFLLDVPENMNKMYAEVRVNSMWGFFQFGSIFPLFNTKQIMCPVTSSRQFFYPRFPELRRANILNNPRATLADNRVYKICQLQ